MNDLTSINEEFNRLFGRPKDKEINKDVKAKIAGEKSDARRGWRKFLAVFLVAQVIFQDFFLYKIGSGGLNVDEYVVAGFITQVFLQIAGFVFIAIRWDFSD